MPSILVVDNYDSFTYNLVQYLAELGAEVEVVRNDAIDLDGIRGRNPDGVLLGPGPGRPEDAGITLSVIEALTTTPILGVCLGHQSLAQAHGGAIVRAERLMHGRTSPILHEGAGVFAGLPSPFTATRYHSLIVDRATVPGSLELTAWTEEGEVMGLRHRARPLEGVQFHPESFLTNHGHRLLGTWLGALPSLEGVA